MGHSRPGRPSSKSGHVRCAAESGSKFRALARPAACRVASTARPDRAIQPLGPSACPRGARASRRHILRTSRCVPVTTACARAAGKSVPRARQRIGPTARRHATSMKFWRRSSNRLCFQFHPVRRLLKPPHAPPHPAKGRLRVQHLLQVGGVLGCRSCGQQQDRWLQHDVLPPLSRPKRSRTGIRSLLPDAHTSVACAFDSARPSQCECIAIDPPPKREPGRHLVAGILYESGTPQPPRSCTNREILKQGGSYESSQGISGGGSDIIGRGRVRQPI